jgi:hypothetical protein
MAITPVCVSLERSFESLCNEFRDRLNKKNFYELASVIQGLRPWKDLINTSLGPVTAADLHSNPDDPPDVTLVSAPAGKSASVEHTDFSNPMHAYASHLHLTKMPGIVAFLPPLYNLKPTSREDTLQRLLNPPQRWDSPMDTISSLAFQLEECVAAKLKSFQPDILVVTDKMALDFKFDVAVMYVVARVREGQLDIGRSTVVFYSEMDTIPTRFASYWLSEKGDDLRYRNSKGFDLSSLEEIRAVSGLDSKWCWFSP